jgi:thioester reductase-like protein
MRPPVLLTGATGFLGMEVLARLIERGDREIIALVRAADRPAAEVRLDAVLHTLWRDPAPYRDRVRAVAGDLTTPGLGLRQTERTQLAEDTGAVLHCAASIAFDLPLEEARAVNVEGTREMVGFAREARALGRLERFLHVSTAYVAGTYPGTFRERQLVAGQQFRNTYEQTKYETERMLAAADDLSATVVRPSIVMGESDSGWTPAFNVLYWPLRAFARGLFTEVPAIPTALVDVVSVDYVADAVHALCESPHRPPPGATYHLTAGPDASTIDEIAKLASRYFRRPPPRVLPPAEYALLPACGEAEQSAMRAGQEYFPYFSIGAVFESETTRARLDPEGISASPLREYMERLLDFATRSRWGKAPITRVDALAA